MSDSPPQRSGATGPSSPRADAINPDNAVSREEMQSALFAQLVMQQSNLAMMLLGNTPHPETGQPMRDLEAARLFIDQLEMLEVKTRGNLDKHEEALLKQSLMALRMAFVEAVEAPEPKTSAGGPSQATSAEGATQTAPAASAGSRLPEEEEQRKKFSKKY